ncbi:MAG: AAA family ATPase [Deltaproteobacteria bacterium]|nr:AAA family ATPase [Deltaproteobacteria bacterium]
MTTLLSESFLESVGRLSAGAKARVLDFIAAFQKNPASPAVSLERVTGARSSQVWAGRISNELRAILHKDGDTWVVLHADHHDPAYRWAGRHEVGRHAVTGALQVVEVVERVEEPVVARSRAAPVPAGLFGGRTDDYLVSLGVPETWLPVLRSVTNDDQLLDVCVKLPSDVAERLLSVAGGELVTPPAPIPLDAPLTASPDLQRRFYVVDDRSDLEAVLDAPMARWIAFLHPSQRQLVEKDFHGPAKITGSAGTGKTTVAMHRARRLARAGRRVFLTTYGRTLAENLLRQLRVFCTPEDLERITVSTVHARALAVARTRDSRVDIAGTNEVRTLLDAMRLRHAPSLDPAFVRAEWESVAQLHGLESWAEYRGARRTGRGKPLSVADRKQVWQVFEAVLETLRGRRHYDWSGLCRFACAELSSGRAASPFDAVLVDEVQDLKPPELRFLRALVGTAGELVLFGDAGQRIYPGGFSLGALGIDVRGRSTILRLNYRTTEQIRRAADRVLGTESDDLDEGRESRRGTRSLLRGPEPQLRGYELGESETDAAVRRIRQWLSSGLQPSGIAVFARTNRRAEQMVGAFTAADVPAVLLADGDERATDAVHVGTMHRAKGLEFRAVLVADCSAGVVPLATMLDAQVDPQDRETAEEREKQLLYVAMTRARDELAITWTGQPSPFLAPLLGGSHVGESP